MGTYYYSIFCGPKTRYNFEIENTKKVKPSELKYISLKFIPKYLVLYIIENIWITACKLSPCSGVLIIFLLLINTLILNLLQYFCCVILIQIFFSWNYKNMRVNRLYTAEPLVFFLCLFFFCCLIIQCLRSGFRHRRSKFFSGSFC